MKKNVLLAITGSIAAYKAAELISLLRKNNFNVRCMMSPSSKEFISKLTVETLSGNPVADTLFGEGISGTEHIELARFADVLVVAPATANIVAKLSLGLADDLISTVALATSAPVIIAPAMNTKMLEKETTRSHLGQLEKRGAIVIEPSHGTLACGEVGAGKLAPVEELFQEIQTQLSEKDLVNEHILITGGPTTSPIDPVRYITNHSSGKMAAALCEAALRRGATVSAVFGIDKGVHFPNASQSTKNRFKLFKVHSAEQMLQASLSALSHCTGVIGAAAVLDYGVAEPNEQKQKRDLEEQTLKLKPSVDVLKTLKSKSVNQWFLAFAAETDQLATFAKQKLLSKKVDFIFANEIARLSEEPSRGFGSDLNQGIFISQNDEVVAPLQSKALLADWILNQICREQNRSVSTHSDEIHSNL